MPHDKVIFDASSNGYRQFSKVCLDTMEETFEDISKDSVVKDCLDLYQKSELSRMEEEKKLSFLDRMAKKIATRLYQKGEVSKDIFLPTYFYNYMQNASKNIPNAHFIMSDFDQLFSSVPGIGAPIVSSKGEKSHEK
jgi:hypothetical protein